MLAVILVLSAQSAVCLVPISTSESHISSRYGKRTWEKGKKINKDLTLKHPYHSFHLGVDIVAKKGTRVTNQFTGRVIKIQHDQYRGSFVRIEYNHKKHDTVQVLYHHLDKIAVQEDSWIFPGEIIGTVGDTGTDFPPHLHISARYFSYTTRQTQDVDIEKVFKFCNYEYRHHDYRR